MRGAPGRSNHRDPETHDAHSRDCRARGHDSLRFEPDLPPIQAGATELQQIVECLVANAVDALPEDESGVIEIRTSRCEISAATSRPVSRRATGGRNLRPARGQPTTAAAFPRRSCPRLRSLLYDQVRGTRTGLSAVQGIVRALGGAIRLDSSLHHGTRAELIFPARPTDGDPVAGGWAGRTTPARAYQAITA